METYSVNVLNEHFISEDDIQAKDEPAALKAALRSALAIATEQVAAGKPFFGAVVTLKREEETLSRVVVSVGAAQLKN